MGFAPPPRVTRVHLADFSVASLLQKLVPVLRHLYRHICKSLGYGILGDDLGSALADDVHQPRVLDRDDGGERSQRALIPGAEVAGRQNAAVQVEQGDVAGERGLEAQTKAAQ